MTKSKRTFETSGRRLSQRDIDKLDAIVRDLFKRGGPQRASAPRQTLYRREREEALANQRRVTDDELRAHILSSTECLEREQRRLIRQWRKP